MWIISERSLAAASDGQDLLFSVEPCPLSLIHSLLELWFKEADEHLTEGVLVQTVNITSFVIFFISENIWFHLTKGG